MPADPHDDLGPAREALARHLADPEAQARDRETAGPRRAPGVWIAGAVALLVVGRVLWQGSGAPWVVVVVFAVALRLLQQIRRDRRWRAWHRPHDPLRAADIYWNALASRIGLAFAQIAPSVRGQQVPPLPLPARLEPDAGEVPPLADPRRMAEWARAFAVAGPRRPGSIRLRRAESVVEAGDLAVTRVHLRATLSAYCVLPFFVLALLLVPWPGLLFALVVATGHRQRADLWVEQRWLRGSDGKWYLLDPAGTLVPER